MWIHLNRRNLQTLWVEYLQRFVVRKTFLNFEKVIVYYIVIDIIQGGKMYECSVIQISK